VKLWKKALPVLAAAAAVFVGVALAGVGNGLALLAYVLSMAALVFVWVIGRLRAALPPAPDFQRLLATKEPPEMAVEQLETVKRLVALAGASRFDLFRLRPLVREIVSARLSRRYGVALERDPDRAETLLQSSRAWGLLGPDSALPVDRDAPGWSRHELEQLIEELENL
jgi:hypothetical protein